jgi:hypothetical protein
VLQSTENVVTLLWELYKSRLLTVTAVVIDVFPDGSVHPTLRARDGDIGVFVDITGNKFTPDPGTISLSRKFLDDLGLLRTIS